jgi:ABC-2 type transport system permease protein
MTTALTLLRVERIKLLSTRSPWWCMVVAVVTTVGLSLLIAETTTWDDLATFTPASTQFASRFGFIIMMVMAVIAVTTEYRFGTIRATFLAVPRRAHALLAKTAVVALLATLVGEIAAVASWLVSAVARPLAPLALSHARDYRAVLGVGLVYGIAAVIAVAVGLLVRHSAGAIATVVIWTLLVENLLPVIPRVGSSIQHWLPFVAATNFLFDGQPLGVDPTVVEQFPLGAWASLGYFAAVAAALLALALAVANHRDA